MTVGTLQGSLRRIGRILCAAALAAVTLLPLEAAAQMWNFYTYIPVPSNSAPQANMKLADEMAKVTNNSLKIRVHLGGTLQINATNIGAAVADNIVQMADDGMVAGVMPVGDLVRVPLLVRDINEFHTAFATVRPYIERAYDKRGITFLGVYSWPQQTLFSRKKLTSLEDLNGQKCRVSSPEMGEVIKRFNGTAITMSTPEVSTALERGVIDCVVSASSGGAMIWKDLLKYNYRLPIGPINSHIIVNKAEFSKLSPVVQGVLRDKADAISQELTNRFLTEEKQRTDKFKEDGMVVTEPTAQEYKDAETRLKAFWDEWARSKGSDTAEAMVKVRASLAR